MIINGSPRKKGLISQMLGIMREEAEKRGNTKEKLDFWPESMYFLLLIQKFLLLLHQTNNYRYGAEAGHIDRT